jgi:hypothetical protein
MSLPLLSPSYLVEFAPCLYNVSKVLLYSSNFCSLSHMYRWIIVTCLRIEHLPSPFLFHDTVTIPWTVLINTYWMSEFSIHFNPMHYGNDTKMYTSFFDFVNHFWNETKSTFILFMWFCMCWNSWELVMTENNFLPRHFCSIFYSFSNVTHQLGCKGHFNFGFG